jgi:hypothetical protein
MIRALAVLALLFAEGGDRAAHRLGPEIVERRLVARRGPIAVREPHRIAERVDLPFPLGDARFHVGLVGPRAEVRLGGRILHERVGVRVDQDAPRLPCDQPDEDAAQAGILRREVHIGLHLRRTVAQPQRLDIAGDDERIGLAPGFAIARADLDRGVERVGVAILEQPGEFGVGDLRLHAHDLGLDRGADEAALRARRSLAHKWRGGSGGGGAREAGGDGQRGGPRHDVATTKAHSSLHGQRPATGALIENGASAFAAPQAVFGVGPITNRSVPPFCNAARVSQGLSCGVPLKRADWM